MSHCHGRPLTQVNRWISGCGSWLHLVFQMSTQQDREHQGQNCIHAALFCRCFLTSFPGPKVAAFDLRSCCASSPNIVLEFQAHFTHLAASFLHVCPVSCQVLLQRLNPEVCLRFPLLRLQQLAAHRLQLLPQLPQLMLQLCQVSY